MVHLQIWYGYLISAIIVYLQLPLFYHFFAVTLFPCFFVFWSLIAHWPSAFNRVAMDMGQHSHREFKLHCCKLTPCVVTTPGNVEILFGKVYIHHGLHHGPAFGLLCVPVFSGKKTSVNRDPTFIYHPDMKRFTHLLFQPCSPSLQFTPKNVSNW